MPTYDITFLSATIGGGFPAPDIVKLRVTRNGDYFQAFLVVSQRRDPAPPFKVDLIIEAVEALARQLATGVEALDDPSFTIEIPMVPGIPAQHTSPDSVRKALVGIDLEETYAFGRCPELAVVEA